jgi:hypothetical protein
LIGITETTIIFVTNLAFAPTKKRNKLNKNPIKKKQKKLKLMKERRKYPRLEKNLPIKLQQTPSKDFDIATETTNISASGAYCAVTKSIKPMTKLKLTLLVSTHKSKVKKIRKIDCQGVVVRKEKNENNKKFPYRIGIFFNEIDNQDKKFLRSYINSFFLKNQNS